MPRLNRFNQRGAFVFFPICGFIFLFSLSLAHTRARTHSLSYVSQLEPNSFSLNVPTALTMELNTDMKQDHTHLKCNREEWDTDAELLMTCG